MYLVAASKIFKYTAGCALPKVSQQRCDELAIQLLAVTRADRTAGSLQPGIREQNLPLADSAP